MPLNFARRLTGRERTAAANVRLGVVLAFIAGAINAGGFLAVQQYTSHMTGMVSAMADNTVLGAYELVWAGLGALAFFVLGAMTAAILVNYARRRDLSSEYALPLLCEALLLLGFGVAGVRLHQFDGMVVPGTVMLLCFIMGLQNAVVSKISGSEIRTTHITGTVTDIGIELGKWVYWNRHVRLAGEVRTDRSRLVRLLALASGFFGGALAGAWGFKAVGYIATVPLALVLLSLAIVPAFDDLGQLRRGPQARAEPE